MLLIWGMRVLRAVLGTGEFHCPQCGGDTTYQRIQPRQWFTLFFIPVIPLKRFDTHVECTRCGTAYLEEVLSAPTTRLFEYQVGLAHRAAVTHLLAGSSAPSAQTAGAAVSLLSSCAGVARTYDAGELAKDVASFASADVAIDYVRPLALTMTLEGREEFLRRIMTFAAQMEPVSDRSETFERYANALGLSPAHAAGIAATLSTGSRPGGAP